MIICASQFVISAGNYEHISACVDATVKGCDHGCRSIIFVCGESDNAYKILSKSKNYIDCPNVATYYKSTFETVGFKNCVFKQFQENYFENFEHLHTVNISNVGLEKLEMKTFLKAKGLQTLIASNNILTVVPAHLFVYAQNITHIDFSNNTINRIDALAFDGPTLLNTVNLSQNFISQLDARSLSVPSITVLDLSHNNLSNLSERTFGSNLKQLNLSYNLIGNLEINTFAYLPNLEQLNLRHTNISSIQLGTFSHQHKLISLDISENHMKEINFNLFLPIVQDLRSLHLGENQLTELKGFRNEIFPELELLDIKNNRFNCSYLQHFMENINWEKLHLHVDPNAVDPQKTNIRGVNCEIIIANESAIVRSINKMQSSGLGSNVTITDFTYNKSSENDHNEIIRQLEQNFSADIFIIKIILIIICFMMLTFLILYLILNRSRSYSENVMFSKQSTSPIVQFSNSDLL